MVNRSRPKNLADPQVSKTNLVFLGTLVTVFCAINAHWIWSFRYGQPLDIDEAGYFSYALVDYSNLMHGGIAGWVHAIEAPGIQAPLTTAFSALLFYVTGPHIIAGFVVPLCAGAACLAVTYYLGCALGSPPAGLLASLLLASCPVTVNYSRTYHFSMPAMLIATLALLAIIRSNRFSHRGWVLVFGLCLGLMPLARTMTIAFIPGLLIAAAAAIAAAPDRRLARLAWLGLASLLGMAVLAVWLVPHFSVVSQYLVSFGYGSRALEYAHCSECSSASIAGPSFVTAWITTLQSLINGDIFLPDFILLCLGALSAVLALGILIRRRGWRTAARTIAHSPWLPIALFTGEVLVAVNSSVNKGSAFFAPIMPALFLLAVYFIYTLVRSARYRMVAGMSIAGIALALALPFLTLTSSFATPTSIVLPVLQGVTVTDGRANIERYEAIRGFGPQQSLQPISPANGRAWMQASDTTGKVILAMMGRQAVVAFGFRNELYNVNTVNLEMILQSGVAFAMQVIDPQVTGDSVAAYKNWLTGAAASPCVLLTSDRNIAGDFAPPVIRSYMIEAATQAGYAPRTNLTLPDGEHVTFWVPTRLPAYCHPEPSK